MSCCCLVLPGKQGLMHFCKIKGTISKEVDCHDFFHPKEDNPRVLGFELAAWATAALVWPAKSLWWVCHCCWFSAPWIPASHHCSAQFLNYFVLPGVVLSHLLCSGWVCRPYEHRGNIISFWESDSSTWSLTFSIAPSSLCCKSFLLHPQTAASAGMVRDRRLPISHRSSLHLAEVLGIQKQLSGSLMLEESKVLRFTLLLLRYCVSLIGDMVPPRLKTKHLHTRDQCTQLDHAWL